jgi:NAD(P)-dependent dehydrogenase (short-subunit alcohol dehydrogenase family)
VNNAGIEGQFAFVSDLSEEEWDRVLDINLKGTFLCLKYDITGTTLSPDGGFMLTI